MPPLLHRPCEFALFANDDIVLVSGYQILNRKSGDVLATLKSTNLVNPSALHNDAHDYAVYSSDGSVLTAKGVAHVVDNGGHSVELLGPAGHGRLWGLSPDGVSLVDPFSQQLNTVILPSRKEGRASRVQADRLLIGEFDCWQS